MAIWVGTSGYNYPEWKGSFYPEDLSAAKMLPYYAERLSTVEINYTFYRAPNKKILEGWSAQTPEHFKFTLKAPKKITHEARLKDCEDRVKYFLETAKVLGPKLGVLFFQLRPAQLQEGHPALRGIPRHDSVRDNGSVRVSARISWLDDDLYQRLRSRNLALCIADSETRSTPVEMTADYAYFRLRDEGYKPADLTGWAKTIREKTSACKEVFVYFKHEEAGTGPPAVRAAAARFLRRHL